MSEPATSDSIPGRILMTADAVGGVWTYALELARSLAPHGVEIALAVMGGVPSRAQRGELSGIPNVRLHESRFRLEWMDDPWSDVDRAGDWLLDLAARWQPDLVHLNGYSHAALPWEAPTLAAAHSCVLSWWAAVKGEEAPPCYDEYRRRVGAGLVAADLIVAPTSAMLGCLAENYGALPRQQRVIPNARDGSRFVPAVKQPRVLSAGRLWDAAKNVAALDAAAPNVRWPIFVAGDCNGPSGSAARLRAVNALGELSGHAMAGQLASSAIYASPARYEPFGLSALEAGLCGCALVLGDIESLREVWADAAVFVDPDDPVTLAGVINKLIDQPEKRMDLGRRARIRALQFSSQKMAQGYLSAYRACLARAKEAFA